MSVSYSFIKVPILVEGTSPKDAFTAYQYAKFNKQSKSSWAQDLIAAGRQFSFVWYGLSKESVATIPYNVLSAYDDYVNKNGTDKETIDFWCSSGIYIDEDIKNAAVSLNIDDVWYCPKAGLSNIEKAVNKWFNDHTIEPIKVRYGYTYDQDEDSYRLRPVDGVEVEFEDGSIKRLDAESTVLYVSRNYTTIDERATWEELKETLIQMRSLADDNYMIFYEVN